MRNVLKQSYAAPPLAMFSVVAHLFKRNVAFPHRRPRAPGCEVTAAQLLAGVVQVNSTQLIAALSPPFVAL
jgi:hypothetical protein